MSRSTEMRRRRRVLRAEALAAMTSLTDAELKNLRYEIGREIGIRAQAVRLEAVKDEISRRGISTPAGVHISDHAIVRYMERVKGVNIAAVRAEIGELAARARSQKGGRNGRRRDEATGLVFGCDETVQHVTTVFSEDELPVLEVVERS
jgi:hypothetical protein